MQVCASQRVKWNGNKGNSGSLRASSGSACAFLAMGAQWSWLGRSRKILPDVCVKILANCASNWSGAATSDVHNAQMPKTEETGIQGQILTD